MKVIHKRLRLPKEIRDRMEKELSSFINYMSRTEQDYNYFLGSDLFETVEFSRKEMKKETLLFLSKKTGIEEEKLQIQMHIFREVGKHKDDRVGSEQMTNVYVFKTTGNYILKNKDTKIELSTGNLIRFNYHKEHEVIYAGVDSRRTSPVVILSIDKVD